MKTALAIVLLSLGSLTLVSAQATAKPQPATVTIQDLYVRSLTAINEGKVTVAEQNLRAILKVQPNHPQARYQLSNLIANRDKIASRARQISMNQTTIAEIDYSDASVSECLESLTALINEKTQKNFTPNFVVKDPNNLLKDKRITLKLSNVPASQVLKYINSSSNSKAVYEEHAIVITPTSTK